MRNDSKTKEEIVTFLNGFTEAEVRELLYKSIRMIEGEWGERSLPENIDFINQIDNPDYES